jgi:alkanesulfonate monooxygenase SsuD/methylene tetrahydromethanopterin reductase-like flavin-dependent oxidoreductase (luciferase family)
MEIGAWVGNNGPATPEHMLSVAQTADRVGLASVWAADHVLWPVEYDSKYPYGGDKYPADFNQPVCIGWLREEFEALGMPFEGRIGRTTEAIELMRTLWTDHPIRFEGRFWQTEGVGVLPHPIQQPIPIWLGGNTPGAQRRAGRLAQGWVPYGLDPADLARGWDGVRAAAESAGRDASEITCSLWAPITITRKGAPPGPDGVYLHGSADELVERLAAYAEAGLQHLLMFNLCEPEATSEQIEWIASEVLPAVAGLVGRGSS